jgi:hypothetical protein
MEGVLMENEKILVPDEGAENTEQTVEKTEKTYTEAEFNAKLDEVLGKKIARNEAKLRKEYDRKYGELETVLRAGMGKEDVGEITEDLRKFYGSKGVKIEKKPQYSAKDIEALAKADADEIIGYGDDEVAEEVDRLAALGADKMSARDKAVFKRLAEHRQKADMSRELSSLGVTEDVYNSEEFKEFKSMFDPKTPIAKVYETYAKTLPKKEFKNPGSMKTTTSGDSGVKDFYTYEESLKFTKKDFDKNPALYEAVCKSMHKW